MTQSRSVLVLLVALVLSMSFAVPAEDVPETAYDESEALPYESTPVISIAAPKNAVETSAVRPRASRLRFGSLKKSDRQKLDLRIGWAYPTSDSVAILEHSLRC
jgi:hypothetical protein